MKILVQFRLRPGVDVSSIEPSLFVREELWAWSRYRSEHCREFYLTQHRGHIAVVAEYPSVAAAREDMASLPLMLAGLMEAEFLELRPFVNWELLFSSNVKSTL